jgi:drug/metabolite transporter superfamily protein YnfA
MLALLALYSTRYYYGNMTEDWTFHLALIAQWAFITMLLDKRFSWGPALVAALTFAIVAWMRTNNGAFWGPGIWCSSVTGACASSGAAPLPCSFPACLTGLVGGPLYAYFQHHDVLAEFKYYAFGIFFEGSYGNGFSPEVGAVGLLRTGLIMLLPAFLVLMLGRRQEWYLPALCATLLGVLFTLIANSVSGHVFDHYDVLYLQLGLLPLACLLDRSEQRSDALGLLCISLVVLTASWLLAQQLGYGWSTKEWSLGRCAKCSATACCGRCPCSSWCPSGAPGMCAAPPWPPRSPCWPAGQQRLGRQPQGQAVQPAGPGTGRSDQGRDQPHRRRSGWMASAAILPLDRSPAGLRLSVLCQRQPALRRA